MITCDSDVPEAPWLRELLRPRRILLVEDNATLSALMTQYIEPSFNVQVTATGTVAGAKELMERELPDALILDIKLPDDTGIALYRWVQSKWPIIPVTFLTAYPGDRNRRDIEAIGPARIYSKEALINLGFLDALMGQLGVSRKSAVAV